MTSRAIIALCLSALPVAALADVADGLPADAGLVVERVQASSDHALPVGAFVAGTGVPRLVAEGRIVQQVYRTKRAGVATLDLFAPLRDQMAADGYELLFECETATCGGFDFRFAIDVIEEPEMHVDLGDFRFASAARATEGEREFASVLVSRSAERGFVQITRIGGHAPAPEVALSTRALPGADGAEASLSSRLRTRGAAVLEAVAFGPGLSVMDESADLELAELATFLNASPERTIVLVGHTDASGTLDSNILLSRKRAAAVLERLVTLHGVAPERVSAEGVGFLAPRDTNETEEGRARNRRVEVVLTPTR